MKSDARNLKAGDVLTARRTFTAAAVIAFGGKEVLLGRSSGVVLEEA